MNPMRVLITAGATQEPIDGVRFITNFSTGRTGAALADSIAAAGHSLYFLHGRLCAMPTDKNIETQEYSSFDNLDDQLCRLLASQHFHLIVHAAAVSDYSVASVEVDGAPYKPGEIPKISSNAELTIQTRRNYKIIDRLKSYVPAGKRLPFITGFKLTNISDTKNRQAEIMRQTANVTADMVVHNDLNDVRLGKTRLFSVFRTAPKRRLIGENLTLSEIVNIILTEVDK